MLPNPINVVVLSLMSLMATEIWAFFFFMSFWASKLSSSAKNQSIEEMCGKLLVLSYFWRMPPWSKFVFYPSDLMRSRALTLDPSALCYLGLFSSLSTRIYTNISQSSSWLHWRCFVKKRSVPSESGKHYTKKIFLCVCLPIKCVCWHLNFIEFSCIMKSSSLFSPN